jgi:hypothetical protein
MVEGTTKVLSLSVNPPQDFLKVVDGLPAAS